MTRLLPRFAVRSRTTAVIQPECVDSPLGRSPFAGPPAFPCSIASATALASLRHVPRGYRQPVIGRGAGQARRGFDDVQPVHRAGRADVDGVPPRGERARILEPRRSPREEVGFERHNDVRLLKMMHRLELVPECQSRARTNCIARHALVRVPPGFGKLLEQPVKLIGQSRRGHGLRQDS